MPSLVYLALLSYCHKKKYIAWPSLNTMSKEMGMAKTTIIRNLNILMKLKVIQNISKGKSNKNYYHHNVYEILPPEKILLSLLEAKNNPGGGSVMLLSGFQNATDSGSEMLPQVVAERYPKHNNLNNINITTTNRENVVVDFKKLKEEGEEKMLAMKEQLRGLGFEEGFIEKIGKDFPAKKIEDKIDLLIKKRNIQNPAGWLMAALKNDYQGTEEERDDEEPAGQESQALRIDSRFRGNDIKGNGNDRIPNVMESSDSSERGNLVNAPEQVSREKALEAIRLIQKNLSNCISPLPSGKRTRMRGNVRVRFIESAKLRGG
jgi:hypothetical protein